MQFSRYITFPKYLSPLQQVLMLAKVAIFIIIAYLFYDQGWVSREKLTGVLDFSMFLGSEQIIVILLVIILMPLNWLIEAIKWQVIADGYDLSLMQAAKGVIQGITLGSILPFGAGDISGRIMSLNGKSGFKTIPSILLAQALQTLVTIGFGCIGVFFMVKASALEFTHGNGQWALMTVLLGLTVAGILLIYKKELVLKALNHISQVGKKKWFIVLLLGIVRYLVFLFQFVILAATLYSEVALKLLIACATWVFLVRTVIPRLNQLAALGIRGIAASTFMLSFGFSDLGIIQVIFMLWLINIMVPAVVGLFLLPGTIISIHQRIH